MYGVLFFITQPDKAKQREIVKYFHEGQVILDKNIRSIEVLEELQNIDLSSDILVPIETSHFQLEHYQKNKTSFLKQEIDTYLKGRENISLTT